MNAPALKEDFLSGQTLTNMLAMADTLVKSGLMPQSLNTKEKVFIALQWGRELDLQPMAAVTNIAVINGRPSLSTDIMHAIIRRNPEYAGIEWIKANDKEAEVIIKRKYGSTTETFRGFFSIESARQAGLIKEGDKTSAWFKYPGRMLKKRALSFALRDAFPDVLAGLYESSDSEYEDNYQNVTPRTAVGSLTANAPSEPEDAAAIKAQEPQEKNTPNIQDAFPPLSIDYAKQLKELYEKANRISQSLTEEQKKDFRAQIQDTFLFVELKTRFEKMCVIVAKMQDVSDANSGESPAQEELEIF